MGNSEIVTAWVAEHQDLVNGWVKKAVERFWADHSIRVPRTEAERRNGMEAWLEQRRLKLWADLQDGFHQQFILLAQGLPQSCLTGIFDDYVWPQVKPTVQRYAIFGFTAAWIGRHMGDATTLGIPMCDDSQWRVPIGVRGYGDSLGQIVLNLEGEVIPELTTTRNDLLEAIHEPSLPSLAAASR